MVLQTQYMIIKAISFIMILFTLSCATVKADYLLSRLKKADKDGGVFDGLPDIDSFKLESDFVKHYSIGWFPQSYSGSSAGLCFRLIPIWWNSISSNGLRFSEARTSRNPFTTDDPFEGNEDEFMKPNSNDTEDDDFPSRSGGSVISLYYTRTIKYTPLIFRGLLNHDVYRTRFFSSDNSQSFLALNGQPQQFKEVNVLFTNYHFISITAGLVLPLYGVFAEIESQKIGSYYYISGGLNIGANIINANTQYIQIADAKERIRYSNGRDTINFFNEKIFNSVERVRTQVDIAFGWKTELSFASFNCEAFAILPLNTVMRDVDWRQYNVGLRVMIGSVW
jgi:hypothetical protein